MLVSLYFTSFPSLYVVGPLEGAKSQAGKSGGLSVSSTLLFLSRIEITDMGAVNISFERIASLAPHMGMSFGRVGAMGAFADFVDSPRALHPAAPRRGASSVTHVMCCL